MEAIEKFRGFEAWLNERIIGQSESMSIVSRLVQRAEMGIPRPGKPKGVFLFFGPTGVGKTETVLRVTEFIYGTNEHHFVRLDMAEYQEEDVAVKKLIGKDRNDKGRLGEALDALNAAGGGVLLCDEIEKAYSGVLTLLLSLIDAARITMSDGSVKSAEACYLTFTSNIGSRAAVEMLNSTPEGVRGAITNAAKEHFSPELYARFLSRGGVCMFDRLSNDHQKTICANALKRDLAEFERTFGILVEPAGAAVLTFLVRESFDEKLGARMVIGKIEEIVGDAWIRLLFSSGTPEPGSTLKLAIEKIRGDDHLWFHPVRKPPRDLGSNLSLSTVV
jgi:ATP-dependent Clp protease ATP-binding subunit ClpA